MSKTLIVNDKRLHGQKIGVPVDGDLEIDQDGNVEVSDEAFRFLKGHSSFTDPEAVVEEDLDSEAASKLLEGLDLDKLDQLSVEDLGQIAEAAGIKAWQRFKAKQPALAAYVRNQLKKRAAAEADKK